MIRLVLLAAVVLGLSIYAWKDWFRALCGLIVLMAVVEHPDMPKSLLGIPGLNPWNVLLAVVILAWAANRRREGLRWDLPRHVVVLLLMYLGVVLMGFVRMVTDSVALANLALDPSVAVEGYSTAGLVNENLVNAIKWVIPGLLLFDGCRSRSRFTIAALSVLAVYFLLGLQVIRWMPATAALGGESLSARSLKILINEVGYHRVNLSMMLAGASWAVLATLPLARRRSLQALLVAVALALVYAQALTAGRMGYVTWAVVGLVLCLLRWWKYLLLAPVVVAAIAGIMPGTVERMSAGFSAEIDNDVPLRTATASLSPDSTEMLDTYTITAGRNIAWTYVTEKIGERPLTGFGRLAMMTTGISAFLMEELGEAFPHPHNAYLELVLDNGILGALLVLPFYLTVLAHGISLFRDRRSAVFVTAGGMACALVLALLVAGFGSQTFYPREGSVGMWCAIGLLFRVSIERSRVVASRAAAIRPWMAMAAPAPGTDKLTAASLAPPTGGLAAASPAPGAGGVTAARAGETVREVATAGTLGAGGGTTPAPSSGGGTTPAPGARWWEPAARGAGYSSALVPGHGAAPSAGPSIDGMLWARPA
jgi:O-antigen ligase